jgi:hypothetical protein
MESQYHSTHEHSGIPQFCEMFNGDDSQPCHSECYENLYDSGFLYSKSDLLTVMILSRIPLITKMTEPAFDVHNPRSWHATSESRLA